MSRRRDDHPEFSADLKPALRDALQHELRQVDNACVALNRHTREGRHDLVVAMIEYTLAKSRAPDPQAFAQQAALRTWCPSRYDAYLDTAQGGHALMGIQRAVSDLHSVWQQTQVLKRTAQHDVQVGHLTENAAVVHACDQVLAYIARAAPPEFDEPASGGARERERERVLALGKGGREGTLRRGWIYEGRGY